MAIDEIEGETCENADTIRGSAITIAPNTNQLNETEQSIKSNTANGTVEIVNYIEEDDVIFLGSEKPPVTILIIDDDNEDNQHNQEGNKKNVPANDRIPSSTPLQENRHLDESQHGIVQNVFDNFSSYPKVTPPLRQYGRKQKKSVTTTPVQHGTIWSPSSSFESNLQSGHTISKVNQKNNHILEHENNDGLKSLSEICDLTFNSPSTETSRDLDETDDTPIESQSIENQLQMGQQVQQCTDDGCDKTDLNDSNGLKTLTEISELFLSRTSSKSENESEVLADRNLCSIETSISHVNSTRAIETINSVMPNEQDEIMQRIQPTMENACAGKGNQVEVKIKNDDIEYHLNKIFDTYDLTGEETQPPPVVVKMNDTPVIISENRVVTVIYKPDKFKFRRKFENAEPVLNKMNVGAEERKEEVTLRKRKKHDLDKNPEALSCRQVRPHQRTKKFKNNSTSIDKGDLRVANVRKKYTSTAGGRTWTNKKYPPIRKVTFNGEMVYKCKDCDFVHPSKVAALRRHMVRHQPVDSIEWFYCNLCKYRAKRKGNLKVHMILHRNPDELVWFKCELCDKKFKHKNGLYSHQRRHKQRKDLELYLCDRCSYKSPCKHTLLRHKFNHEPNEKKKLFSCSICSYSTYNKYYLTRHQRAHSEPIYKCLLCKYEAKYKMNLESHMKVHFPKEEILYCDSCDYSTNRRYTLTLHNRNVHNFYNSEDDQTFFCHNCSFETRFKRCLVKHMSMHSGMTESQEILSRIKTEVTD